MTDRGDAMLGRLDDASPDEAVTLLDGLYERSPWIAERAVRVRPFATPAALKHAP